MEGLIPAFITLFVIMDPFGNLPIFISLTKGMPIKEVRGNFNRSIFVAAILLFVFLFFGIAIFEMFGINFNSFEIAGGLILLVIGIFYVLGIGNKIMKGHGHDLVVPIGTPLLTGPGVITTIIIIVKENGIEVALIASLLTLFLSWLILMSATRVYRWLGDHWTDVISRVMGIVLAAIAVELIVEGVRNTILS